MAKSKSRKRTSKKQQTKPNYVLIAGLALVAVVIVGVLMATSTTSAPSSQTISPVAYNAQFVDGGEDHYLLDVRTVEEFNDGHIEGAANINVDILASRLDELPKDKPIVIYCRSGNRSSIAAGILEAAGFTNIYDLGGIIDWQAAGYSLQ